jgi:hypothetical protein
MDVEIKYALSDTDVQQIGELYGSLNFVAVEQHPKWPSSVNPEKRFCYFLGSVDGKLVLSAIVEESTRLFISKAILSFGPLFTSPDYLVEGLDRIRTYYLKKGFGWLSVQLGIPTGADADYIEYKVYRKNKFKNYFDRENWSSIFIDLTQDQEIIRKNLSQNHTRSIKKANKSGLTVSELLTDDDLAAFLEVYSRMQKKRGLNERVSGSPTFLTAVNKLIKEDNLGRILLVKDTDGKVLGGIILVFQQKTVRYLKGASDPDARELPILHIAMWEAMIRCAREGFEIFDFWGYNHFVDEDDQIFFVNRFKKGFGGSFIFYPKKMYFFFKPAQHKIFEAAKNIYKKINNRNVWIRRSN